MDLDVYSNCPCGSGKKIKFCCSSDVVSEMDKVLRSIRAKQYVAALDQINRFTTAHGVRPAFQILKAETHLMMRNVEGACGAVAPLMETMPNNPTVIGFSILGLVDKQEVEKAFERFQDLVENLVESNFPGMFPVVIDALVHGLCSQRLYRTAHFIIRWVRATDVFEPEAVEYYVNIDRSVKTPLLLEFPSIYSLPPDGSPNSQVFREAVSCAAVAAWRKAANLLESALPRLTDAERLPAHKNIAKLVSCLIDPKRAQQAWLRLSTTPGISEEEAVEAYATSLVFSDREAIDKIPKVSETLEIRNMEVLLERLNGSLRLAEEDISGMQASDENEPPPKAVYSLLTKPRPTSDDKVTGDAIPFEEGDILVHGKQTDREALIELVHLADAGQAARVAFLAEICGDAIADLSTKRQEVLDQVSEFSARMTERPYVAAAKNSSEIRVLTLARQQRVMVDIWPNLPRIELNGKTPQAAATDPSLRIALNGLLLDIECQAWRVNLRLDINEVRRKLGLPEIRKSAFERGGGERSAARMPRLDLGIMPSEQLTEMLETSYSISFEMMIYEIAKELFNRPIPADERKYSKNGLTSLLATYAPQLDEQLKFTLMLQDSLVKAKASPGLWRVHELRIRLLLGEREESQKLVNRILDEHRSEDVVVQACLRVLVDLGLIDPASLRDEMQASSGVGDPMLGGSNPRGASVPAAQGTGAKPGLWTPDAPAGAPSSASTQPAPAQKSKLWVPGMD